MICMAMEVIFSIHALERMEERGIGKEEVLDVLRTPDYSIVTFKDRKIAIKVINFKTFQVVFKEEMGKIIIITAIVR